MNDIGSSRGSMSPDDEVLLADIGRMLDAVDPPPGHLVERVQFAIASESLDVEVARWERMDALAGVRGSDQGTITFTVSDLAVMINLTKIGRHHRIDGWLVPVGEYRVEVRVAEHGSSQTIADEGGRFVFDDLPRGTTQILIHIGSESSRRTVVTPTVVL